MLLEDLERPVERLPARIVAAGPRPAIYRLLEVREGLQPWHLPPLARLVLLALTSECETDASGAILGSASVAGLARTTGLLQSEVRRILASLERAEWLFRLDEMASDPAVATPYLVRLDGRRWSRGDKL